MACRGTAGVADDRSRIRAPVQPRHDRATESTAPVAPRRPKRPKASRHARRAPPAAHGTCQLTRLDIAIRGVAVPSSIIFATFFFYPLYRLDPAGCTSRTASAPRSGTSASPSTPRCSPARSSPTGCGSPRPTCSTPCRSDGPRDAARGGRAPSAARDQDVPDHLRVDRGHLGRRGVGGVPHADQPDGGLLPLRQRDQPVRHPTPSSRGVALSSMWQNLGLTFMMVMAGLQAVPDEIEEQRCSTDTDRCARSSAHDPVHLTDVALPRRDPHDLRVPGVRADGHPHQRGAGGRAPRRWCGRSSTARTPPNRGRAQ